MKPLITLKPSTRYLLQEAGLILLFSFWLLLDVANADLTSIPILVASAVVFSLVGLVWLIAGSRLPFLVQLPTWIWLAMTPLVLGLSSDPSRSALEWLMILLLVFFFTVGAELPLHGIPAELIIKSILVVGAMAVAFAWVGVFQWYTQWLAASPGNWIPDISFRLAAPNVQAWNLNVIVMLAISRALYSQKKLNRIALYGLAAAALGLVFLTSSRGGWLASAAGLGVLAVLEAIRHWGQVKRVWSWTKARWWMMAGLALIVVAVTAAAVLLLVRVNADPTHASIMDARAEYWPPAWQAFLQHPFTGVGLFTFNNVLLQVHSSPPFGIYLHAHSLWFNTLAETGVAGFLLLLTAIFFVGRALFRRLKDPEQKINRPLVYAALAALTAAFVHSSFDTIIGKSFGSWVLALTIGAAIGVGLVKNGRRRIFILGGLVLFLSWLPVFWSVTMDRAAALADQGEYSQAVAVFQQAEQLNPDNAAVQQQLGLAYAYLATQADAGYQNDSLYHLYQAAVLDPDWSLNYLNLGMVEMSLGQYAQALVDLNEAVSLAPDNALGYLNLGFAYELNSDPENATAAYIRYLDLRPMDADAAYWNQTELRSEVVAAWQAENPGSPAATIDELRRSLAAYPNDASSYINLAAGLIQTGEWQDTERYLLISELVYARTPEVRLQANWYLAEIAAHSGDLERAVRLGETALHGYLYQGVDGPGGSLGAFYTQSAFRTPVMQAELVPQVITIGLNDQWTARAETLSAWQAELDGTND
ncbi:MAG TPA: O-antigen ligase family protein [Longilinea sp.]|nr:O-antigen ligase family protein [Longilinea sp.]